MSDDENIIPFRRQAEIRSPESRLRQELRKAYEAADQAVLEICKLGESITKHSDSRHDLTRALVAMTVSMRWFRALASEAHTSVRIDYKELLGRASVLHLSHHAAGDVLKYLGGVPTDVDAECREQLVCAVEAMQRARALLWRVARNMEQVKDETTPDA